MNNTIAVITGDIIGSTRLTPARRKALPQLLKDCFEEVRIGEKRGVVNKKFEIFRGDSFQALITKPRRSIVVALKVIAWLKMQRNRKREFKPEVRISIGVGSSGELTGRLKESNGEAFQISGRHLDEMKKEHQRLVISSHDEAMNKQLEMVNLLLNLLIRRWTAQQSEVIFYLLDDLTQTEIATKLKLSQPSIHQRARGANWRELEMTLEYFNSLFHDQ